MKVSVLISYSGYAEPNDNLRRTLAALSQQTLEPEVIVADNSDRYLEVKAWCEEFGARHLWFPFSYHSYVYSANYNACFEESTGDMVLLLCANWLLAPDWIEKQAEWLSELGPGNLVTTDNDRRNLVRKVGEAPRDWFADKPERFEWTDPNFIDNAKCMIHRCDWLPFDLDFDPPPDNSRRLYGNMHGLIHWGCEQIVRNRLRFWFRRDLEMTHQSAPRSAEDVAIRNAQERWSRRVFDSKVTLIANPPDKDRSIAVDFDGVLYGGGPGYITGKPVPGARRAIRRLTKRYDVVVFTARKDLQAVADWLITHGFPPLRVTNIKVPAKVYLDNNALHFNNWNDTLKQLEALDA